LLEEVVGARGAVVGCAKRVLRLVLARVHLERVVVHSAERILLQEVVGPVPDAMAGVRSMMHLSLDRVLVERVLVRRSTLWRLEGGEELLPARYLRGVLVRHVPARVAEDGL
jgi:hypothetical protein